MAAAGFEPRRRFGQNFLIDANLHRLIADTVSVGERDLVLEVGPGLGFLTRELCARAGKVVAVEIDERLVKILRGEFATWPRGSEITLMSCDAMAGNGPNPEVMAKVEEEMARGGFERFLVVANLPYAVSGPFLATIATGARAPDAMATLVQLEMAERCSATTGSSEYGSLSVGLQAGYSVRNARKVGREVFRPRPNVDSAVLALSAREGAAYHEGDAAFRVGFARFIRLMFAERRKTLRNSLKRTGKAMGLQVPDEMLEACGTRRAQELSADEFVRLWTSLADTFSDPVG